MVKIRGDIKYFPDKNGPWRVRFLCKVIQIIGLPGYYSDVVVEKWIQTDQVWKPVTMTLQPVEKGSRKHVRLLCSALMSSMTIQSVHLSGFALPERLACFSDILRQVSLRTVLLSHGERGV